MSSQFGSSLFAPRYRPFWLLGVVVLALIAYAVYWFARLAEFKETVQALVDGRGPVEVAAEDISYGGFPYRLSATFTNVTVKRAGKDYTLSVDSPELVIERQPWRGTLHLGFFRTPKLTLAAPALAGGVQLEGTGTEGRFSLFLKDGGVERLSTVLDNARISGGPWLETPLVAEKLELHGREVAAMRGRQPLPNAGAQVEGPGGEGLDAEGPGASPTPPTFLEVIVNGEKVQWGEGEPLALMASLGITGEPQASAVGQSYLDAWRDAGGTVEVHSLTLTAGKDDMVIAKATFALDDQRRLLAGGTLTTPCPAMLAGLFGQTLEGAPEGRVQGLISLPFQVRRGALSLSQPQTEWPTPARNRDARCPDLRR